MENPGVLAQFVDLKCGLGVDEFKLIELMIKPPEKMPDPWKNKEFLHEVSMPLIINFPY